MQEAQSFVDGQPQAKRLKTDNSSSQDDFSSPNTLKALNKLQRKRKNINFVENFQNGLKKAQQKIETIDLDSSSESETEEHEKQFLSLPEYDSDHAGASTSSAAKKPSKIPSEPVSDPLKIKAKPPEPTTLKQVGIHTSSKFQVDSQGFVHVYTDGACENNGRFTAKAGLGVFFADGHLFNSSEPVQGKPTNNSGEIQAAIKAIETAQMHQIQKLRIFTDSQFLINAACFWIKNWKRKDWKLSTGKSVVNKVDFMKLDKLIEDGNMIIEWRYIPAHKGHHGNEEADKLAKKGAQQYMTKREKKEFDEFSDVLDYYWS